MYQPALQLNKANASDTKALFFFFNFFSISNGFGSSKIYDKRDDYDFDIVNFPFFFFFFWMGTIPVLPLRIRS